VFSGFPRPGIRIPYRGAPSRWPTSTATGRRVRDSVERCPSSHSRGGRSTSSVVDVNSPSNVGSRRGRRNGRCNRSRTMPSASPSAARPGRAPHDHGGRVLRAVAGCSGRPESRSPEYRPLRCAHLNTFADPPKHPPKSPGPPRLRTLSSQASVATLLGVGSDGRAASAVDGCQPSPSSSTTTTSPSTTSTLMSVLAS